MVRSAKLRRQAQFSASLAMDIGRYADSGRLPELRQSRINLVLANLADRAERLNQLSQRARQAERSANRQRYFDRLDAEDTAEQFADSAA